MKRSGHDVGDEGSRGWRRQGGGSCDRCIVGRTRLHTFCSAIMYDVSKKRCSDSSGYVHGDVPEARMAHDRRSCRKWMQVHQAEMDENVTDRDTRQ